MRGSALLMLEQMDARDKIQEALQLRGFLVKRDGEFLALEEGSGQEDLLGVRQVLKQLNIPVFFQGDRFQILMTRKPVSLMHRIVKFSGRKHTFHINSYQKKWRHFVNREFGVKTNTLDLDPNIAMFVKALNKAGITAITGCDGHQLRHAPNIRLSGPFNGAWMEIIQEEYLSKLNLHYKWNIQFDNQSGAILIAKKNDDEKWNSSFILHDTTSMAYVLLENANDIRRMKKVTFKRNKEMKQLTTYFADERMYNELRAWMKLVIKEN